MNVQVKHNSVDITNYVISYDRQHKICTGIGEISIVIEEKVNRTFNPWDTIDIHENGSFQVRYYVTTVYDGVPGATITLDAQDISKRVVDYFISESQVIEYPTYTRYWIEYFLNEVGVSYEFTTESPGSLLSNYTQLGMVSAYEQLLVLLQQSGWFMYFDGNGKAIIGELSTDLSSLTATFGKTDILEIQRKTHDKMLRNRALVLGAFDPLYNEMSKADITVHTPWNYDHNDIRTMVISNSNIPNSSTAYSMAMTLVKEFARINDEKTLSVHGARNVNLGDSVGVLSNVYNGTGLITTFGVSMSRDGLITNLILDERCPRLYGYFDFGDAVYVGTYGDGVWKKPLRFVSTWSDFSNGLATEDMAVTDLHINNGLYSCVTSSGNMYYTIYDVPWKPLVVETLESSLHSDLDSEAASGVYIPVAFSGLMARSTIIDRENNRILYGIDTWSGENMGDYFLSISGYGVTQSGWYNEEATLISGYRGWVVSYEFNNLGGEPDAYPIHVSGNYNIRVVDIENDGVSDYVTVAEYGASLPNDGQDWNFGEHFTQPYAYVKDYNSFSLAPLSKAFVEENLNAYATLNVDTCNQYALAASDNGYDGIRWVVGLGKDKKAREFILENYYDAVLGWRVSSTVTTSTGLSSSPNPSSYIKAVYPTGAFRTYRFIEVTPSLTSLTNEVWYQDWDAYNDSWGTRTQIGTFTYSAPNYGTSNYYVVRDGILYISQKYTQKGSWNSFVGYTSPGKIHFDVIRVGIISLTVTTDRVLQWEMPFGSTTYYHPASSKTSAWESTNTSGDIMLYPTTDGAFKVIGFYHLRLFEVGTGIVGAKKIIISGDESTVSVSTVYTGTDDLDSFGMQAGKQLTTNIGIVYGRDLVDAYGKMIVCNGSSYTTTNMNNGEPDEIKGARALISDITDEYYLVTSSVSGWMLGNANNPTSPAGYITVPSGYSLLTPYSVGIGTYENQIYWKVFNTIDGKYEYIPYAPGGQFYTNNQLSPNYTPYSDSVRGMNFGGFFISEPTSYSVSNPKALVHYVNFGEPESLGSSFALLKRDGYNFYVIQREGLPIRADISNNAPLLSVTSGSDSFQAHYLYDEGYITVTGSPLPSERVEDYRYALIDTLHSGFASVVLTGSGIYWDDLLTLSGIQLAFDVPSGYGNRIETSNYAADGQYICVTTSGNFPDFYQKDPYNAYFDSYPGLPESRATIIRIDDRF